MSGHNHLPEELIAPKGETWQGITARILLGSLLVVLFAKALETVLAEGRDAGLGWWALLMLIGMSALGLLGWLLIHSRENAGRNETLPLWTGYRWREVKKKCVTIERLAIDPLTIAINGSEDGPMQMNVERQQGNRFLGLLVCGDHRGCSGHGEVELLANNRIRLRGLLFDGRKIDWTLERR